MLHFTTRRTMNMLIQKKSRRLLALSEGEVATLLTAMRQVGVGSQGGDDALAIIRTDQSGREKLLRNGLVSCGGGFGGRPPPETCIRGRLEASRFSFVEQEGVEPTPKDRGAKPADLDGPLACSLALEMVWVEARLHVAVQQAAGIAPWVGANSDEEVQRLRDTYQSSLHLLHHFQLDGAEKITGAHDRRHALQENGGLADFWYLDDGKIFCQPTLGLLVS